MAATQPGFWQHAWRWPWRRAAHPVETPEGPLVHPGEMPGVSIGGFALVRTFGNGALGELHLATDAATGLPVAIKTVRFAGSELTRDRFLRESAAAARLQHPGIVAHYAAGVEGKGEAAIGWIAMEWVAGHDLSRYTDRQRLLPEALAIDVAIHVADALEHAHTNGVIHRDLKPANVLINLAAHVVKVSDFGCAHLTDAERSRSGLMIGSPAYMAPEQCAGVAVDARCDVYALGVILYQLLTGRLPFESDSLGDLMAQIAQQPAPLLQTLRPDLPPLLSDVIARALAKSPIDRQEGAGQFAHELRTAASSLPANRAAAPASGARHNA